MTLALLAAFNLALLAALASPGPALLVSMRTTLVAGRRAGILCGLGLATMAAGWTTLALLGLEGLFRLFPWAYAAFRIIGALYLIVLAVRMWRSARDPLPPARARSRAFLGGLAVNLANPKSVLFAAAVLVLIFPPDLALWEKALIVANHFVVEVVVYTALACLMATRAIGQRYLRAKAVFDRISAGVLGALGLRLLTERGT